MQSAAQSKGGCFLLYRSMSGLVFGSLFFPSNEPTIRKVLALASFALAFLVRPIWTPAFPCGKL
ncbi:hypothetical protein [Pseudarthrobacter phenanthrenivorans]|uniref:hypothetical protein n=1 Tax=Pseudarthrobacter phenanthrenivorans TaxID=361575 RepID=UPI002F35552F